MTDLKYDFSALKLFNKKNVQTEPVKQPTPEELMIQNLTKVNKLGAAAVPGLGRGTAYFGVQTPKNNRSAILVLQGLVERAMDMHADNPTKDYPYPLQRLIDLYKEDPTLEKNIFAGSSMVSAIGVDNQHFDFSKVPAFLEYEIGNNTYVRIFASLVGESIHVNETYYIVAIYKGEGLHSYPVDRIEDGYVNTIKASDLYGASGGFLLEWLLAEPNFIDTEGGVYMRHRDCNAAPNWRRMDHVH